MTPIQFAEKYSLSVASPGEGAEREVGGVYCCDLLSMVMGRAHCSGGAGRCKLRHPLRGD